jgi:chromosome segregation ATPase
MNVENIKSELQQVLDSDVALRKEYNEIKRSLSDYRNQLIQRDEDCKRLQVSIDVLNTKLVVMERDNTNYKSEVSSFKELRNNIREQLQEKQDEINGLLSKIDELNGQLASISSEYELKIAELQNASQEEIAGLTSSYETQLAELKSNTTYQQSGIRNELETKINDLTNTYNTTYQETVTSYEAQIEQLKSDFNSQLESLKQESESRIASLSGSSEEAVAHLTSEYELKISGLTHQWGIEKTEITSSYENQISSLSGAYAAEKTDLINSYESKITDLNTELSEKQVQFESELNNTIESLTQSYSEKENELKAFYENELLNTSSSSGSLIETLKAEYEEKLSNTVLHSNTQNSKLAEDMSKVVVENEHFKEKIREMVYHIDSQNTQIEDLTVTAGIKDSEIANHLNSYSTLSSEFEAYKVSQLSTIDEQVSVLNAKITDLEALITEKDSSISELTASVEDKNNQISGLTDSKSELQEQFNILSVSFNLEKENFEHFKNELEVSNAQLLQNKDIEFNKLLAENTSLISEIDATADKLEATEGELQLITAELTELKAITEGKAADLKETLDAKNFEITTLTANNMALQTEMDLVKAELENVRLELKSAICVNEGSLSLQEDYNTLLYVKGELENQLSAFQATVEGLNSQVAELNEKIAGYEIEIGQLKSSTKADEQDAFVDRLFKQIDLLSDERLNLLNEKEEMANQLLKMNDTVASISQHVDSHNIDITELDSHRKNVILAGSSSNSGTEKTVMKKQINELVREIDKCIALLSA